MGDQRSAETPAKFHENSFKEFRGADFRRSQKI